MLSKNSPHTPKPHQNHTPNKQHSERSGDKSSDLYSILSKEKFNIKNRPILILIILKTSIISKISKQKTRDGADTNEKCENKEFSLRHLDDILETSTKDKGLLYLQNFLKEIGSGFSRRVFDRGNGCVIKYDHNPQNYKPSQNTVELHCYQNLKSPILPKIYLYGKDCTYLICEKAEQIQPGDFQRILHIPFGDDKIDNIICKIGTSKSVYSKCITIKKFIHIMENQYSSQKPKNNNCLFLRGSLGEVILYNERKEELENISETEKKIYKNLAIKHPRFKELAGYIKYVISTYDTDYCDLSFKNFGIVIRDGKPYICILDSGRSGPI